jgi:hypothetical protein
MPTDRELDQLIDAALPGYSSAEPRPGLEDRTVARAFAEPPHQRRLNWAWTLAIPVLVCLLTFLVLPGRRTVPHNAAPSVEYTYTGTKTPSASNSRINATPPASSLPPKTLRFRSVTVSQPATRQALPKQDIFPSPSPLTAEEQTIVAYNRIQLRATKTTPAGELEINPIRIADLQIEPLTIPTLDLSEPGRNDQQP